MTSTPTRERAYDPARLRRAAKRQVDKIAPMIYRVAGNDEPYYDVNLDDCEVPCTCKDAFYHGRGCLHELAARLHHGDSTLVMGLGLMLAERERHAP